MTNRIALINAQTNICENISLDERPASEINIGGYIVIDADEAGGSIGYVWDGLKLNKASKPPTQDDYARAIQAHVDAVAQGKGYANGFALAGYRSSTVPAWAAESETFLLWRDTVWLYAYAQMAAVQAQQRSQPTVAELVQELPQISWPA